MKRCLLAALVTVAVAANLAAMSPVAADATDSVHLVRYAADGTTILAEKTVDYKWMEANLPVHGDGVTHYYHQGPVFEGDAWDTTETINLKDKGAVKGTAAKDLCDLVGGMAPGDEIALYAKDGWHTEFAYENVYQPPPGQGVITLCWYNGEEVDSGERYGVGYPGDTGYRTALQIVFMAETTNAEGQYVFGNNDMRIYLPEEKYQHFYEGLPSTNGLSGKWIDEIRIYSQEAAPLNSPAASEPSPPPAPVEQSAIPRSAAGPAGTSPLWIPIAAGIAGIVLVSLAARRRKTGRLERFAGLLAGGLVCLAAAGLIYFHPWQQTAAEADNWQLTVVGEDSETMTLNMKEIRDMDAVDSRGGFFSSVGVIYGPYDIKGVPITDICGLVGGISPDDIISVSAPDGYSMVLDYEQVVLGEVDTYDPATMRVVPHDDLKLLLIYEQDGKALAQEAGYPLRLALAGADEALTEGLWWVKWVNRIEVRRLDK